MMNKQRAIIGLVAFLAVLAVPLYAPAAPNANQTSPLSVSLDGSNPAGDYVVYVLKDDVWKEVGRLSFDKFFRQKELDLSKYVSDDSNVKVRIVQKGGGAAHIDAVLLGDMPPAEVKGTDDVLALKKVSRKDFDVIDAFQKSIELTFPSGGSGKVLSLTARVEGTRISKTACQFPLSNLSREMAATSEFYRYRLMSEGEGSVTEGRQAMSEKPFFKEYSLIGSGHPSGFTYGWVRNDDKNLYVTIDFTPDDTMDGDKDYSKVYVKTEEGIREFKVSVPETTWGRPEFTYTDKVAYQHKVYDFKIPLKEIGIEDVKKEKELLLAFAAYGTASCAVPPEINCPEDITVDSCTGAEIVNYSLEVSCGGFCSCSVTCDHPSESEFTSGTTPVSCTVTNDSGQSSTCTFDITVNGDVVPPEITCPANIAVTSCSDSQAVTYTPFASDECGIQSLDCTPPSGSDFASGATNVSCTATDPSGNSASCSFDVTLNCPTCRSAGFWSTHAGTECPKKKQDCGSRNITQTVISDECDESCLEICGEAIRNTDLDSGNSALEAMCVSPRGDQRLQLASQLTATSLNCCTSVNEGDCEGLDVWSDLFTYCNSVCALNLSDSFSYCIQALDCLNKGGNPITLSEDPLAVFCQTGTCLHIVPDLPVGINAPAIINRTLACNDQIACLQGTPTIVDGPDPIGIVCLPLQEVCTECVPFEETCYTHLLGVCADGSICTEENTTGTCKNGDSCDAQNPCADLSQCQPICDSDGSLCKPGPAGSTDACTQAIGDGKGKKAGDDCAILPKASSDDCSNFNPGEECCGSDDPAVCEVCEHDLCETGLGLDLFCDPCVTAVCFEHPECCDDETGEWSTACVSEANDICGLGCVVCSGGETNCSNVCVDTSTDPNNCNGCGNVCGGGDACCSGTCEDLQNNDLNCGTCGNDCTIYSESCCGTTCVDLQNDFNNCGECGFVCPEVSGMECLNGVCTCPVGEEECFGECVDTSTDPNNCGSCGNACDEDQDCEDGNCVT